MNASVPNAAADLAETSIGASQPGKSSRSDTAGFREEKQPDDGDVAMHEQRSSSCGGDGEAPRLRASPSRAGEDAREADAKRRTRVVWTPSRSRGRARTCARDAWRRRGGGREPQSAVSTRTMSTTRASETASRVGERRGGARARGRERSTSATRARASASGDDGLASASSLYCGLDFGTSSARMALVDDRGTLVRVASRAYEPADARVGLARRGRRRCFDCWSL